MSNQNYSKTNTHDSEMDRQPYINPKKGETKMRKCKSTRKFKWKQGRMILCHGSHNACMHAASSPPLSLRRSMSYGRIGPRVQGQDAIAAAACELDVRTHARMQRRDDDPTPACDVNTGLQHQPTLKLSVPRAAMHAWNDLSMHLTHAGTDACRVSCTASHQRKRV